MQWAAFAIMWAITAQGQFCKAAGAFEKGQIRAKTTMRVLR
jgi:hypothetical protein